jgi:hypothetical protein
MPVLIRRVGRPWNAGSSRYRRPAMTGRGSDGGVRLPRAAPGHVVRQVNGMLDYAQNRLAMAQA